MTVEKPLTGTRVVTIAQNLPGPLACARLLKLGATVIKVEPPGGDSFAETVPAWYKELNSGQQKQRLDLKDPEQLEQLHRLLDDADLLITATRPAALDRLGLGWNSLHQRHPELCQVAVVGYPPPRENEAGHDLTYQASFGLLSPPAMPKILLADFVGGEQAISAALLLLLTRATGGGSGYRYVALSEAAVEFADPLRFGATVPGNRLGGGLPEYNLYACSTGWIALAALEPHFKARLLAALELTEAKADELSQIFATRPADEWEHWAQKRDIPLVAVQQVD